MIKLSPSVIYTGFTCFIVGMILGAVLTVDGLVAVLALTAVGLAAYTIYYLSQREVLNDEN